MVQQWGKKEEGESILPFFSKESHLLMRLESLLSKHLLKVLSPSIIIMGIKIQHVFSRGQTSNYSQSFKLT